MLFSRDKEFSLSKLEERVLEKWRVERTFQKSVDRRKGAEQFIFFEGPPTANGRPGIHHILARSFKDVVLRYKTMRGYHVPRHAGWDTHGLPVELEVEKKLGLKSKKEIETYGIARFNEECKKSVWEYRDEWERITERMGFWIDTDRPYITYENGYIESLWWIIKEAWKKKLFYKGHRVVPWCTRCGTALSSHELAQGYKTVTDEAVTVKFPISNSQFLKKLKLPRLKTYILAWTTTPWTLPGNVALAVNKSLDYALAEKDGEILIYAKARGEAFGLGAGKTVKGKDLVGLKYKPLFDVQGKKNKASHTIYAGDFVTAENGTGVVHIAPMYGEDDYALGEKFGLPKKHTVREDGTFTRDVKGFSGLYAKAEATEKKIIDYLKSKNYHLKTETYSHEYPSCWRCDTPLIYYARDSWFIKMSGLRTKLLGANKSVNWVPSHLKEGRFGEWLKEVKDWNFSRERYWGTPLPVWECGKCETKETIGSFEELSVRSGGARNRYILIRHGESESNAKGVASSKPGERGRDSLTMKGRVQVDEAAKKLKKEGIDLVFHSDFTRTTETARIIAEATNAKMRADKRIREIDTGILSGRSSAEYRGYFGSMAEKFHKRHPEGEHLLDVAKRVSAFFEDTEKKYKGKTIALVSHEYPLWMAEMVLRGWGEERALLEKQNRGSEFIENAEAREVPYLCLPRNAWGIADPHRPYVDSVSFACKKCGKKMHRIKEVADVWFDSGAMPFAQAHFPFENRQKSKVNSQLLDISYPADYICEAMDQTRGWFYTLLATSTLLGFRAPYKNVISLGLIHDKHGRKMSKSKGNVVSPWEMIEKYGVDAVRWYFYSATPAGEPKNFDEMGVVKAYRRFHQLLYNSYVFWKTYQPQNRRDGVKKTAEGKNVLDAWILARLNETTALATEAFDAYDIRAAALALEGFTDDLSKWYIRRSRRRFQKPSSPRDHREASETLGFVLREMAKLSAPFSPFFAEALYEEVNEESFVSHNSVHLEDWPNLENVSDTERGLIEKMAEVRRLASVALAKRAEVGIKVRQPLGELRIRNKELSKEKELLDVLAEEVNVKKIVASGVLKEDVELDCVITPELKEEGMVRELIRAVQELRQKAGLDPQNVVVVMIEAGDVVRSVLLRNEKEFLKEVGGKKIEYARSKKANAEEETKIDGEPLWLGVRKI